MDNNLGNKKTMANNIRYYMDRLGVSRKDICTALNLKYSTFSEWLQAKKYPRIDKIEMMANYFGIEKADLIEERKPEDDAPPDLIIYKGKKIDIEKLTEQEIDNVVKYIEFIIDSKNKER